MGTTKKTKATGRKRNYRHEYDSYHKKPAQRKKRSQRTMARRKMVEAGKAKKGDGKDVHHKKPLRKKGTNAKGNLATTSRKKNRGWRKGKSGYK